MLKGLLRLLLMLGGLFAVFAGLGYLGKKNTEQYVEVYGDEEEEAGGRRVRAAGPAEGGRGEDDGEREEDVSRTTPGAGGDLGRACARHSLRLAPIIRSRGTMCRCPTRSTSPPA